MARIPGGIYFIIGVFVAGYSFFINTQTGNSMKLFMYLGAFLIFIGIVKIIFAKGRPRRAPRQIRQMNRRQLTQTNRNLGISICPRCRSKNYYYARFCHMCGYRLR